VADRTVPRELQTPRAKTRTAIIGGGQGCRAILELVSLGRLSALNLDVICVVDPDPNALGSVYARSLNIPTRRSIEEVLDFSGVELLIELTGRDEILTELYHLIPPGTKVIDHQFARVFWDLNGAFQKLREQLEEKTQLEAQRKEAVQRFEQFLSAAHDMIIMKDLDGRYLVINPVAAALFNREPAEWIGKTDLELFGDRLAGLFSGRDQEVLERQCHICHEETLTVEGKKYHLHTVRFPLFDYKGNLKGVGAISRDITEQKRLQRSLIQSEKLAAIGKLAAGIAHEINNPLSGVLTFIEDLLIDVDPNDPVRRDYEVIYREALRCRQIVRDLLDYTRLQQPVRQRTDVNSIVMRAHGLLSKQAAFRNIEFDLRLCPTPHEVNVDPGQMQQVILNLVMNASEAMDGKGTITISTGLAERDRGVFFEVADHGCGIPEDQIKKIFEPFFSTKGSRGNGLGLSVVQSIVEQHAGNVAVRSGVGTGTTFHVRLPGQESVS